MQRSALLFIFFLKAQMSGRAIDEWNSTIAIAVGDANRPGRSWLTADLKTTTTAWPLQSLHLEDNACYRAYAVALTDLQRQRAEGEPATVKFNTVDISTCVILGKTYCSATRLQREVNNVVQKGQESDVDLQGLCLVCTKQFAVHNFQWQI